jgi:hypothetical protein
MTEGRRFTVEEANALLPGIVPLLEDLRDAQQILAERHDDVQESVKGNGGGGHAREYSEASQAAAAALRAIQELGVLVRDPATGLIDFPAERDGEEIFLCFRLGEDRVAWWHPTDTGFAGRQPL